MDYINKRSGTSKKTLTSSSLFKQSLKDFSPDSSKKVCFTDPTLSTRTHGSNTSHSDPTKFKSFYQFLANCDNLQREVSEVSNTIEQNILRSKKEVNIEKYLKRKIRNKEYFEGLKKIEERIKCKKEESMPKEMKSLKTMVVKNSAIDYSLAREDVTSQRAREFLERNKRKFGKYFNEKEGKSDKGGLRRKLSDIKVNPQETIFEEFLVDTAVIKQPTHRLSVPTLSRVDESPAARMPVDKKAKLPSMSLAVILTARARADANRFFADRKQIASRLKTKKKSVPF